MTRQRFLLLLIAALVAIVAALVLDNRRHQLHESQGAPLFPSLAGKLDSVTTVMIRKGGAAPAVTVHKTGTQWTVAERGDYPADVAKLRKLMSSLLDARIVEEKTSDPARYAGIGVDDPSQPGSLGAEITVVAPNEKLGVIVGKAAGEGSFVRRVGEKGSYSIEPAITLETEPRFWIESRLLDVPAALIQSIEFKPAAGTAYAVHRLNPADNSFSLDGVPAGRKPLDGHALAPAPTMLAGLDAEDVSSVATIDFKQSPQVIVTLTNGNDITFTGAVVADKHWIQVKSTKDPALMAKAEGRAFEVASYRYDALFKSLEQFLAPKETPAPKGSPATASPGTKKPRLAAPKQTAPMPVPAS